MWFLQDFGEYLTILCHHGDAVFGDQTRQRSQGHMLFPWAGVLRSNGFEVRLFQASH